MIRRPPRSTLDRSSAASDVYKRQIKDSDDSKYYVVEGHRNYKKPDETGVRTGEKGKDNGVNNDEQKRPSKSKVKEKKAKRKIKNNW